MRGFFLPERHRDRIIAGAVPKISPNWETHATHVKHTQNTCDTRKFPRNHGCIRGIFRPIGRQKYPENLQKNRKRTQHTRNTRKAHATQAKRPNILVKSWVDLGNFPPSGSRESTGNLQKKENARETHAKQPNILAKSWVDLGNFSPSGSRKYPENLQK